MGGLGSADGQPRHYSPDVGGSVILQADHRPKRMEEPTSTVVCSPISHQKLSSFFGAAAAGQRLDALYLFAGLFIEGCVAEVDVPVQARVRVVLLFSGWVR